MHAYVRTHALSLAHPKRKLKLIMSDQDDRRELPTDPIGTEPPTSEELSTRPEIPPSAPLPRTSAELMQMPGFDSNMFQHVALVTLIDAMNESKAARASRDPELLLERQRKQFETSVDAGYNMVREPVIETLELVKELIPRVTRIEKRLEDGESHFQRLDKEVAGLNQQIGEMRAKIHELELKLKDKNAGAQASATPG